MTCTNTTQDPSGCRFEPGPPHSVAVQSNAPARLRSARGSNPTDTDAGRAGFDRAAGDRVARAPLPMGAHGSIKVARRAGDITGSYVAKCRFRDFDGRTRLIERSGATKTAASRALRTRSGPGVAQRRDRAPAAGAHVRAGGRAVAGQARRPGHRWRLCGHHCRPVPAAAALGDPAAIGQWRLYEWGLSRRGPGCRQTSFRTVPQLRRESGPDEAVGLCTNRRQPAGVSANGSSTARASTCVERVNPRTAGVVSGDRPRSSVSSAWTTMT